MDMRIPAKRHPNIEKAGTVWRQSTVLKVWKVYALKNLHAHLCQTFETLTPPRHNVYVIHVCMCVCARCICHTRVCMCVRVRACVCCLVFTHADGVCVEANVSKINNYRPFLHARARSLSLSPAHTRPHTHTSVCVTTYTLQHLGFENGPP